MKGYINDLHFHSTESDGENTPEEIVKHLSENYIGGNVTLTDHNNITKEVKHGLEKKGWVGLRLGAEVSVRDYDLKKSIHVLTIAEDFKDEVSELLQRTTEGILKKLEIQIIRLKMQGYEVDFEDFKTFIKRNRWNATNLNNGHLAKYVLSKQENLQLLVSYGYKFGNDIEIEESGNKLMREVLKDWNFGEYGLSVPDYEVSPEVLAETTKTSGAVQILAHPQYSMTEEMFLKFIRKYRGPFSNDHSRKGGVIDGIEISSTTSKEWVKTIYSEGVKGGFLFTSGSDNHDLGKTDIRHGEIGDINPFIPKSFIIKNLNILKELTARK